MTKHVERTRVRSGMFAGRSTAFAIGVGLTVCTALLQGTTCWARIRPRPSSLPPITAPGRARGRFEAHLMRSARNTTRSTRFERSRRTCRDWKSSASPSST